MNKIERVRAMLAGDSVDRVPAGFWFHFASEYAGGDAMARRHIDYYHRADPDIMKVMNDTGYAKVGSVRITSPEDWARLEPTPVTDPLFQSHIQGLAGIVDALGDETLVMTTAFNPYNQAVAILKASDPSVYADSDAARRAFVAQCRQAPEPVIEGLSVIAGDLGRYYRACVTDAGANGIYYSAQGGERDLFSDEEHAQFVAAFDLRVLDSVGQVAEFVVGHFCGQGINLARFRDYPVQVVNWAHQSANLSLSKGQALFGGLPILGGLDERGPLVTGPREAIRREIVQVFDEMGARGFMLGAGCTVPSDTDVSNLAYAREVAAELSA